MPVIKDLIVDGYEKVVEVSDKNLGLNGFIAIHSTHLGPALGGIRIYPYNTKEDALKDVLRLAKGMTYKSAVAECGFGGGKSVIIIPPKEHKNTEMLLSFAQAINELNGLYIGAEDLGSTCDDIKLMAQKTRFLCGLPTEQSSGDPSRFTAWGVFKGIEAICQTLWNHPSVKSRTIAVQGLGNVGSKLCEYLFWQGANLIISDTDNTKVRYYSKLYNAQVSSPDQIIKVPCDILAPCALGGIINNDTISELKCKAIGGAANNQLLHSENGLELLKRNILYAPDYIINAGGLINVTAELEKEGWNPKTALEKVDHIFDSLLTVFKLAKEQNKPTNVIADHLAEYKIQHSIGKRIKPVAFHSMV